MTFIINDYKQPSSNMITKKNSNFSFHKIVLNHVFFSEKKGK